MTQNKAEFDEAVIVRLDLISKQLDAMFKTQSMGIQKTCSALMHIVTIQAMSISNNKVREQVYEMLEEWDSENGTEV